MERILLVQTGFLGDVILSTAVIPNLKKCFPHYQIDFLTTPLARELVAYHPMLDNTLTFDKRGKQNGLKGLQEMARQLKARNYARVFCLHKSWRTAMLLYLAKIPLRYGFAEASATFLYTNTVSRKEYSHDVWRNLAILKAIGVTPDEAMQDLHIEISQIAKEEATSRLLGLQSRPIIGFAPGSVWATKRWPKNYFLQLARKLIAEGYGIVLLGGPGDQQICDDIAKPLAENCLNLAGKISLQVSTAVIDRIKLLVTNDSAPLHIASARKTPTVAIFCATIPEFGYGPWRNKHQVIGIRDLPCRPCGRHGAKFCPTGTHACQTLLQPSIVEEAISKLLAGPTKLKDQHVGV